ncbi:MAG: 1-(5-phosphoribosyl)-5-[(5-phosphoribosylamino)methylideneamino]imidazole-4-carboxamide isomerase [Solirubrobacteraceae bacterium]
MILYPALDILNGHAVRLVQGDFAKSTTYASDPLEAAKTWARAGAERLHIVDLDGARRGEPVNLDHVRAIAHATRLAIELGGGLRSPEAIDAAVAAGAARVVIGTAAFTASTLLDHALRVHGDRVVVSVDARHGQIATAGWTATESRSPIEAVKALTERGVRNFIYTDVERDGMLGGLDLDTLSAIADALQGELLYAGGVGALADLVALRDLHHPQLVGVIVGKALYEQRFTIAEANAVLCS